jgi:ABC-type sugar transport system ATPase subunit
MTATHTANGHEPVVRLRGVSKMYPGVHALRGVDFTLRPGEVRALLGRNGAGKSTLVKILSGVEQPTEGTLEILGNETALKSPVAAARAGIATVHQELSLVPELTVAENLFLGRWQEAAGSRLWLRPAALRSEARNSLRALGVDFDVTQKVGDLTVAQQQVVEIAKALSHDPRLLILDEPTSALPTTEVEVVLDLVTRLASRGVAIVYVSHRMAEIPRIADSVTVLRDGLVVGEESMEDASIDWIVQSLTGYAQTDLVRTRPPDSDSPPALEIKGMSSQKLHGLSMTMRRGEIVGLAGVLGSGRTELLKAVVGIDPTARGEVWVHGQRVSRRTPTNLARLGVGLAPEDRKAVGLALDLSVGENLLFASQDKYRRGPFLLFSHMRRLIGWSIEHLSIKVSNPKVPIRTLSGGNQQKVILGRWLNAGTDILLLDEPTRGIDVETKAQIYSLLNQLRANGTSILMASSEIDELFLVCDRMVVLSHGRIIDEVDTDATTPEAVLMTAMEGSLENAI